MRLNYVYNATGQFDHIQQTNDDATIINYGPKDVDSTLWNNYVSSYGMPPMFGVPTGKSLKPDATMLQEFKALSNANQQALTSDLLTRLLLQNPDIATKYGLTVTQ